MTTHANPARHNAGGSGVSAIPGLERVLTPQEVAVWLSVDESSVRRWFAGRPGVLRLGSEKYNTIRIPLAVLKGFVEERSR
jgi:hypothetical protein